MTPARNVALAACAAWTVVTILALVFVRLWFREREGRGGPMPVSQAGWQTTPLRTLQHPVPKTLEQFRIREGQTVLELGPGPGYFTPEAAQRVGPSGRVLSLDLQPGMLALLQQRLRDRHATNAHPIAADATRLPLADASVDAAYLSAVLGEIPDRLAALRELHRVVRPGGTLAFLETLTDPDYVFVDTMLELCRVCGFRLLERRPILFGYTMVFARD